MFCMRKLSILYDEAPRVVPERRRHEHHLQVRCPCVSSSPGRFLTSLLTYRVREVAERKGASMAQVAIAWTLSKDGVSAPIIGSTNLKNLEDIIGAPDTRN